MTQESLAVDANVDRTYISGIENRSFNATIDVLDRLAGALKIDVRDLLAIPESNDPKPHNLAPGRKPK